MNTTCTDTNNRRIGKRVLGGNTAVRGIGLSTHFIIATSRYLAPDDARAVKWFSGYSRLLDRPAEAFADELGMDAIAIRNCLTNAEADATQRAQFTGAVNILRRDFEARLSRPFTSVENPFPRQTPFHQALGKLARTQPVTETRKAVAFAEAGGWAVTEGLERMGKTVAAAHPFLHRLDTAAWSRVPSGDGLRTFLIEIGRAVGVPCNDNGDSVSTLRARIGNVLGPGKIETLFLDQFHAVLPVRPNRTFPARLELLMDWVDSLGVNVVGIATPQWGGQLNQLAENPGYRVGQAVGRIKPFKLRETLTQSELEGIALSRQPDLSERACTALALHAKQNSGYCGTLMNTLNRFRQIYADQDERPRGLSDAGWQLHAVALAIDEDAQLVKGGAK